jgi:hypothetical protein
MAVQRQDDAFARMLTHGGSVAGGCAGMHLARMLKETAEKELTGESACPTGLKVRICVGGAGRIA